MDKSNRTEKNHGMNWISQKKRLSIYLRDGLACAYCSAAVEEGVILSLDHLKPYSKGGGNEATNLVTCCMKCNSSRGNRSVRSFCVGVAAYLECDSKVIESHVINCSKRSLTKHLLEANEMIARRGSCAKVLKEMI